MSLTCSIPSPQTFPSPTRKPAPANPTHRNVSGASSPKAKSPRAPAWLVGQLVHEAIRRWRFDDLDDFLKPFALESGLTDEAEIHAAIQESRRILERLRAHPLFAELDSAGSVITKSATTCPTGAALWICSTAPQQAWFIIDFKTDEVRIDAEAQSAISQNGYDRQVARYARGNRESTQSLQLSRVPNVKAKMRLVFLNVNNRLANIRLCRKENPMPTPKSIYQIKVTLNRFQAAHLAQDFGGRYDNLIANARYFANCHGLG